MAVKWAVANGQWNAGATWNDGVVPTANDDVYLNGFHIANLPDSISVKSLHNDANSDYSVGAGGYVEWASSNNAKGIIGDVFCESTIVQFPPANTGGSQFTINGNIHSSSVDSVIYFKAGVNRTHNLIINGNISFSANCKLFKSDYGTYRVTIVGNVDSESTSYLYNGSINNNALVLLNFVGNIKNIAYSSVSATITTCTGSGSWQLSENQTITTATITGDIIANGYLLTGQTLNINGSITYKSTNNTMGVRYTTLNILNPDTFTWKDITEPRSNPFIILTNAEMNNRQQYPSEDVVKQGVEYVWGEKVGTYQQPPESVVLKGYEYDTITAEENDIATYNLTRYIYVDYGTLHWFELKTTTTDIVTTPSQQSITIDGDTVVADTDYVVEYNDVCYQWSGSAWGSITTKNIGTVKTDILTNPTETTLCVKKGTLETSNISQQLISRLENCATIETVQQLLVAHLDN